MSKKKQKQKQKTATPTKTTQHLQQKSLQVISTVPSTSDKPIRK